MDGQVSEGLGGVGEQPVSLAAGADLLADPADALSAREDAVRRAVSTLAAVNGAGVVEPLEGLPIDVWLAITQGMNAAERAMLLDAGDALATMPALQEWWDRGVVSWSVVRDVVGQVRSLGREGRAAVDARLAASGRVLADMDPDQIAWAVADAVEAVRGAEQKAKAEDRAQRESFLSFQMDLWGGSRVYGELDAIGTAVITGALDAITAQRDNAGQDTGAGDHGSQSDPLAGPRRRRSRAQQRARSLVDLCGRGADGRVRRPLVVVHVPLDRVTETAAGLLEVAVPGGLPRLSAALVDNLAVDADVRAVLFGGARPLHVTRRTHAQTMHPDTRLAVTARDLGARDFGARTTVPLSHVHHLEPGRHHPDRLLTVSGRGHLRIIHRHGWTAEIDPTDGAATWTRPRHNPGQTIRTLPWGTPLGQPATRVESDGREPR